MRTTRLALHSDRIHPRSWLLLPDDNGGGGGDGASGGATGDGGAGATGATGDAGSTGAAGGTGDGAGATGTSDTGDNSNAMAAVRKEFKEERARRQAAEAKQQTMLDGFAKALGLDKGGKDLTPEQLTEKLNASDGKARTALTHLAIHRAATKAGADADALLDSRTFLAEVKDLDPDSDKFAAEITAAIAEAVKNNPKFKASQAGAGKSGGEFNGGSGDSGQITDAQLKTMTAEQITDALEKGKLAHLLA